eukprot:1864748-Amphidinium_carterae.1
MEQNSYTTLTVLAKPPGLVTTASYATSSETCCAGIEKDRERKLWKIWRAGSIGMNWHEGMTWSGTGCSDVSGPARHSRSRDAYSTMHITR